MLYNPRRKVAYAIKGAIPVMLPDEARTVDDAEHDDAHGGARPATETGAAARGWPDGARGQRSRSTTIAMPWPPPTHIDSRPKVLSVSSSALSSVVMMRAPVWPNGWPSAMAPPFTLSLSHGIAEVPRRRDDLCGERLVDLDEVDVVDRHASRARSAWRHASTGPRPMISGSSPVTPDDDDARERGDAELARPWCRS